MRLLVKCSPNFGNRLFWRLFSLVLLGALTRCETSRADGRAFAWGYNAQGELGNGTTAYSYAPVVVNTNTVLFGKNIVAVAAGGLHSLALDSNGQMYAWGGTHGESGTGAGYSDHRQVVAFTTGAAAGKSFKAIAAGLDFSLGLDLTGHVFSAGNNVYGQLGAQTQYSYSFSTEAVAGGALEGKSVTAISSKFLHSLALTSEGRVYSWGANVWGTLGDGTTINRTLPVAVDTNGVLNGKTIVAVSAGYDHNLVLDSNGVLYAWGKNSSGQLGDSTKNSSTSPVAVDMGPLAGKTIVAICAGYESSLVLTSEGRVYQWGILTFVGGRNYIASVLSSVPVALETGDALGNKQVLAIAGGNGYALAATSDGSLYGWGYYHYDGIDGSGIVQTTPAIVDSDGPLAASDVNFINAGINHNLAVGTPNSAISSAGLSHTYTESLINTDDDDTSEFLQVDTGLNVTQAGSFSMAVDLQDASGIIIETVRGDRTELSTGAQVLSVRFNGRTILEHGQSGPYKIARVRLYAELPTRAVLIDTDMAGFATAAHSLAQFDHPPAITVLKPDAVTRPVSNSFGITFSASDEDNPATVALYYDTDDSGYDGTLIQQNTASIGESVVKWDTSALPAGRYYIYAVANDGIRAAVKTYSAGSLEVDHTIPADIEAPTVTVTTPSSGASIR